MPLQNFLLFLITAAVFTPWFVKYRRRLRSARRSAFEDRLLWVGLAAGLFDSEECPATSRLEIALAALARKLGLRGAMVTLQSKDSCTVVAMAAMNAELIEGLTRGAAVPRRSLYCGNLNARGQSVAIEYASVSTWRHHAAFQLRGWESYIAVNCGLEQGEDLVVAFFDSMPRETAFTRSERALVGQLAPWIASMVGGTDIGWERSEAGAVLTVN